MNEVITILEHEGTGRDACVKVLQEIQGVFGYLPAEALRYVADHSQITRRQIYGVATFYELFRFKPPGRHQVKVCRGTACHVHGAPRILAEPWPHAGIESQIMRIRLGKSDKFAIFSGWEVPP